ncbi:MAG: RidA family protein [Candidatus Eremiobacteraeota bacterium]|nr:RidA family protein [Candidatus Eremiobacteraeota bacterium]
METINPESWLRPRGYSNGIVADGRILSVAGQIGWDERGEFVADDFAMQAAQALRNIVTIVRAAGGRPDEIVRLTWYVTDKREYIAASRDLGENYAAIMGSHYPAMSLIVVAALLEDRAKVEIEATAVLRGPS